jgi:hypothetical protein
MKLPILLLLALPLLLGLFIEVEKPYTLEVEGQTFTLDITRLTSSSVTLRIQPINQNPIIFLNETANIPIGDGKLLQLTPTRFTTQSVTISYTIVYPEASINTQQSRRSSNAEPLAEAQDSVIQNEQEIVLEPGARILPYIVLGLFLAIGAFILVILFVLRKPVVSKPKNLPSNPVVEKSEIMKDATISDEKLEPSKITSFDEYESLRKNIEKKF